MEIRIGSPDIFFRDNGKVALFADISGADKAFTLWYEVEKESEEYLCSERSDAFLVALFPWVMMRSSDSDPAVIVCDAPVSEQLHHQLTQYYIPALTANISYYHPATVKA